MDKVKIFTEGLLKYKEGSEEYKAHIHGHKEANEFLLAYIDEQENKEVFADLKNGAEFVLEKIKELED